MTNENNRKYDDIIDLPHHVSATRPRMSMIDRAAQFSPFAALTGYDAAIKETGRLTDRRIELSEMSASFWTGNSRSCSTISMTARRYLLPTSFPTSERLAAPISLSQAL